MALADIDYIKLVGGLNHESDYLSFRVDSPAAMDAKLQDDLLVAEGFISDRVSTSFYTGTDTANPKRDRLFKRAEALFTLAFAGINPKTRRVYGTHAAFDSETSERYEELVDNEYLTQAELLIEPYVSISESGQTAFAMPTLLVTPVITPDQVQTAPEVLQDDIDYSLGVLPCGRGQ
jgi:hypothetical protein